MSAILLRKAYATAAGLQIPWLLPVADFVLPIRPGENAERARAEVERARAEAEHIRVEAAELEMQRL